MDEKLKYAIFELWHISRTALSGQECKRWDRVKYIRKELARTYPELIVGLSNKKIGFAIEDALEHKVVN